METIETYLEQAEQYRSKRQWEQMLSCYRMVSELQPDYWQAYVATGDALSKLHRWKDAIVAYQQALELNAEHDWTHHNLSIALCRLDRQQEALDHYQKLAKINPDFWQTHQHDFQVQLHRADTLFRQQQWREARTAYRQAIDLYASFAWTWINMARCLIYLKEFSEAQQALQQAIQLKPNNALAHYLLGEVSSQLEVWDVAVTAYRTASQLPANSPDIVNVAEKLDQALQNQGRFFVDSPARKAESPMSAPEMLQEADQEAIWIPPQIESTLSPRDGKIAGKPWNPSTQFTVWGYRSQLQDLYSARLKLLVPVVDAAIIEALDAAHYFTFYQLQPDLEGNRVLLLPPHPCELEDWVEIQLAPQFFLGFCAASSAGKDQMEPLMLWWAERTKPEDVPPCFRLAETEATRLQADFWQQMGQKLLTYTGDVAQRLSLLQQQYLELRTLHETIQNAFVSVEEFLSQAKLPSLQLAAESQPSKKQIAPEVEPGAYQLRQLLPAASRGLAQVEIHVARHHLYAKGNLVVTLWLPEEGAALAQWEIPYQHLQLGWFPLDLPRLDIGRRRDVELIIEWQTRIGPAPSLSLSELQPIPDAQIQIGAARLDRSLAFRLWTGLAGSRCSVSPYATLQSNADSADALLHQSGYLGQGAMSRVVEVTPNLPTDELPYILVIGEGEKIQTQPRRQEMTVALLPYCFPPGATELAAIVATEHVEAGVVEYAMAIIPDTAKPDRCFQEDVSLESIASLAYTGWVPVQPASPHQLRLAVSLPVDQHCHIAIATRLPTQDQGSRFAWARWRSFQITKAEGEL